MNRKQETEGYLRRPQLSLGPAKDVNRPTTRRSDGTALQMGRDAGSFARKGIEVLTPISSLALNERISRTAVPWTALKDYA